MTTQTSDVLADVGAERRRQDRKWGGPAHDDEHTAADFNGFMMDHIAQVGCAGSIESERQRLIEVAALAVAAVERLDRLRLRRRIV